MSSASLASIGPEIPSLELAAVHELSTVDQWVLWKLEGEPNSEGKRNKTPKHPRGFNASSSNPETWSSYQVCAQAFVSGSYDGLGFVFSSEDDYVGVDFDHILDEDLKIKDPSIAKWISDLNTYTEVSPSGDGLKCFLRGDIPSSVSTAVVEMYDQGRFFTITGNHYAGTPEHINWSDDALSGLYKAVKKTKTAERKQYAEGARIPEGVRHETLKENAVRLGRLGLTPDELRGAVHAINESRCSPALDSDELDKIISWTVGNIQADETQPAKAPGPIEAEVDAPASPPIEKPGLYPLLRFGSLKPNLSTDYLIKNLLDRGSMAVMYGQSGSSKSFCALEMSMAIASGLKWRGIRVRKGRVAYIAAEGGHGIANRLYAMQENVALGNIAEIEFYLVRSTVKLTEDSDDVDRFIQTIEAEIGDSGIDLVVIDTLSRSIAGRNENSPQDMSAAVEAADRLRQGLGTAVLIVHHSGKNEAQGARGHSSLKAALETELEVKQVGDSYSLTVTKQREHESGTQWWHRLEPIEIGIDDEGEPVTTCLVRPVDHGTHSSTDGKVVLKANEERCFSGVKALLGAEGATPLGGAEAVSKAELRDWVESNCKVPRNQRRGVVSTGLKGLKKKGIVEVERESVFLIGGLDE